MRDNEFEWDDRKAAANLKKHEVSFEQARNVFDDVDSIDRDDPDPDEPRTVRIGRANSMLLVVVYTEREGRDGITRIRIISAREASTHEEATYRNA
jgi:uncharacterized protein